VTDDEKRKERPKEEISDLEKIASPDFSGMIAEEGRPLLPVKDGIGNAVHSSEKPGSLQTPSMKQGVDRNRVPI
jgi:hypothetical protein